MSKTYAVYIMASVSGVLYIGVTNNLFRRVNEHQSDSVEGFTRKYRCHKLIYYELTESIEGAIAREKQLKNWARVKKTNLINSFNPEWKDLSQAIIG